MSKAYLTFCLNGVTKDPTKRYGWQRRFEEKPVPDAAYDRPHRYAFVTNTHSALPTFTQLTEEPILQILGGDVFYGWYDAPRLVVASIPHMVPEIVAADGNALLFVRTRTNTYSIPLRELDRTCISALKFGTACRGCPRHEPDFTGSCYLSLVTQYAIKNNIVRPAFFVTHASGGIDRLSPQELHDSIQQTLREQPLSGDFEYISPRMARENQDEPQPGVSFLRYYSACELDRGTLAEERVRLSARSEKAARTRQLQRACRKDCVFAPCDKFSTRSCRSWVHPCRETSGPFSLEGIHDTYRRWMQTFPRMRSPEEIAFIAYHAGRITRIFGYELTLSGMDKTLQYVEFSCRGWYPRFRFRYEDALEVLTTGWRRNGGSYASPYFSDAPEMREEELWTYAQLRQFRLAPGYATRFGYVTPEIRYVEWQASSHAFVVHTRVGWDRHVNALLDAITLFGIPSTLEKAKLRAPAEEACPESSPDTPL